MLDDGRVAFVASAEDHETALFLGASAHALSRIDEERSSHPTSIRSHPDLNLAGDICFFAARELANSALSKTVVVCGVTNEPTNFTTVSQPAGPLGPTINASGQVAFRGFADAGVGLDKLTEAIFRTSQNGSTDLVALGTDFGEFHGLPVIDGDGRIIFRASCGIYRWVSTASDSRIVAVATLGSRWKSLGRFPDQTASGTVVFVGEDANTGEHSVFTSRLGRAPQCTFKGHAFASIRGALIDERERIVFYATPPNGTLGIYRAGEHPTETPTMLVAIGEPLGGARVVEFALNPVSIAADGQVAVRVRLDDDSQAIVRFEAPR